MVDPRLSKEQAVAGALAYWAALAGLACATALGPPAAPPGTPAARARDSGFGAGLRIIEAKGQGLAFPLPDPGGWRLDKREKHSWVARHPESASELLVRAWHFDAIAQPEDCERQARVWRVELPRFAAAEIIRQDERLLAGTYHSQVTVGVQRAASSLPERLIGGVLGFGSDARECLMLAFSTSAEGPGARQVIAERLGVIAGTVFERVRRLDIEGRVSVPRL